MWHVKMNWNESALETTQLAFCGAESLYLLAVKTLYLLSVLRTFTFWSAVCHDILPQVIVYLALIAPDILLISLFKSDFR